MENSFLDEEEDEWKLLEQSSQSFSEGEEDENFGKKSPTSSLEYSLKILQKNRSNSHEKISLPFSLQSLIPKKKEEKEMKFRTPAPSPSELVAPFAGSFQVKNFFFFFLL